MLAEGSTWKLNKCPCKQEGQGVTVQELRRLWELFKGHHIICTVWFDWLIVLMYNNCNCHSNSAHWHPKIRMWNMTPTMPTGSNYLEKLARLWMVLATRVVFRDAFSVGNCCVKPNNVGERTAGQMKRRKTHELTSWSQTSWLCWWWQRWRNDENTHFSSLQRHVTNVWHQHN